MLTEFQNHLAQSFPLLNGKRLLVAVSGGVDSIVLSQLLHRSGYDIALAHCNFGLRGNESDGDETFVIAFGNERGIPVFTTSFDTQKFAADYKLSTQLAARELRYRWFRELLGTEHYDYVLTAHHANDNIETFFINLSRGTGIEGLTGIPVQNEVIIRPLLPFSRAEVERYAIANALAWREDSSNSSNKYLRNKIRHEIIPGFTALNPAFLESFSKTQHYLKQTRAMAEDAAIMVFQRVATRYGEEIHFNLPELTKLPNYTSYLFYWLQEFGFSAWEDVYGLVNAQSGKQVFSAEYGLLKNRETLILFPLKEVETADVYLIKKGTEHVNFPIKIDFIPVDRMSTTTNKVIFADADSLQFPLEIRRWHEGDAFFPLGMGGKSKKVSKFFKDEKLSLHEKRHIWLLCSGDSVVWVIGLRQDERFKIEPTTTNILQIALNE